MLAVLVAILMSTSAPAAQSPRDARLTVTVVDQTGAVIPNATVTVTALAEPTRVIPAAQTGDKGVASVQGLGLGRYAIKAEFPGFQPQTLKDVQLRAGDNRHVLVLAVQGLEDSVTVSRDAREAASDRRERHRRASQRLQARSEAQHAACSTPELICVSGDEASDVVTR